MPITDPSDLSGLGLWLRADSLSLSDGDPVSTWTDESASARSFVGSGAARPTFKTGILNGLPVVRFDGTDDRLASSASFDMVGSLVSAGGNATTVFLLMKQIGSDDENVLLHWSSGEHTNFVLYLTYGDTLYFDCGNQPTARLSSAQPVGWDDEFHIVECFRNGSSAEIVIDDTLLTSGSMSTSLASGSLQLEIGGSTGVKLTGDIGEIVVYNRALNTTERGDVYDYLFGKWMDSSPAEIILPLLAAGGSFFEPTVTPGTVTITLPLLAATGQFFTPTIVFDQTVTLPLLAAGGQFFTPTVSHVAPRGLTVTIGDRLASG